MTTAKAPAARATHHRWDAIPEEPLNPLLGRKMVTGQRMMVAQILLKKGAIVPRHQHHNEQITYVLSGALRFTLGDGEQVTVRAGEVLCIPPDLPHSAEALEDTLDVDLFDPPREDWLAGTDAYLRGK